MLLFGCKRRRSRRIRRCCPCGIISILDHTRHRSHGSYRGRVVLPRDEYSGVSTTLTSYVVVLCRRQANDSQRMLDHHHGTAVARQQTQLADGGGRVRDCHFPRRHPGSSRGPSSQNWIISHQPPVVVVGVQDIARVRHDCYCCCCCRPNVWSSATHAPAASDPARTAVCGGAVRAQSRRWAGSSY